MFNYSIVEINRSETTVINLAVAPWEVALLEAVNGSDRCRVVGEQATRREPPAAEAEFARLTARYGSDSENGRDYVELVYGTGQRGVDALAKEIAKVKAPKPAAVANSQTADADLVFLRESGLLGDDEAEGAGVVAIDE